MSILNLEGAYENELAATGEFNPQAPRTALRLPSGQRVVLPTEMLLHALNATGTPAFENAAGSSAGPTAAEASATQHPTPPVAPLASSSPDTASASSSAPADTVIPLLEEQLQVGTREVETARVRVRRETEERIQNVSVNLTEIRWEIEHVPVDQKIETAPEIRHVGDTIIFPLVEERMVVSRELWLREEVHVHRVKSTTEKNADFSVKRDILVEERADTNNAG